MLHLDQECPICQVAAGHQGVPLRMRAATNPGGTGHAWTKNRFMITPDKDPIKARQQGVRVTYTGKHPSRPFIPSFVTDNPYLDQEGYIRGLQELSPVERAQLLEGDWGASHDARFNADQLGFYTIRGDYFVLGEGSGRVHPYASLRNIFCTIDPATTSRDGPAQASIKRDVEPSKTVMCAWGLTPDMNLMLLDMSRGMWEAPEVVEAMVAMYKRWNPSTFVCENNGPGKPIHQFASARGIPIKSVHKHKDKVANSFTAQLRVRQGRLWVPEPYTPWKQQFIDEVFTWTGDPDQDNDIVDNLSDACNHVSWDMTQGEGTEEYNLPARQGPFTINTFTSNPFNATM